MRPRMQLQSAAASRIYAASINTISSDRTTNLIVQMLQLVARAAHLEQRTGRIRTQASVASSVQIQTFSPSSTISQPSNKRPLGDINSSPQRDERHSYSNVKIEFCTPA